jgi:hypothetical protein
MQNRMCIKGLVLGIILLIVGTCTIQNIKSDIEKNISDCPKDGSFKIISPFCTYKIRFLSAVDINGSVGMVGNYQPWLFLKSENSSITPIGTINISGLFGNYQYEAYSEMSILFLITTYESNIYIGNIDGGYINGTAFLVIAKCS